MGTFEVGDGLMPHWLKDDLALAEKDTILREYMILMTSKDIVKDEALERLLNGERAEERETLVQFPLANIIYFPQLRQQEIQSS